MWVDTIDKQVESDLVATVSIRAIGLLTSGDKRRRTISFAGQRISVGPFEQVILAWVDEESGEETNGTAVDKVRRRVPKLDEDGEPVYESIITATGSKDRWNISEPILTLTDTWFATSAPAANIVGTAQTPSNAPTPPSNIWTGYTKPVRGNHPAGWVLDDRQTDELFLNGSDGLWQVVDTYAYYQTIVPD
jgi:hypothetical protein